MIERIRRIGEARRRRKTLNKIRRKFEKHGHRLDGVSDAEIEAALTRGGSILNVTSLSAKTISLALRQFPTGDQQWEGRKCETRRVLMNDA